MLIGVDSQQGGYNSAVFALRLGAVSEGNGGSNRRACGMIDSCKDMHPLRANFCFESVHRLLQTEATLNAR